MDEEQDVDKQIFTKFSPDILDYNDGVDFNNLYNYDEILISMIKDVTYMNKYPKYKIIDMFQKLLFITYKREQTYLELTREKNIKYKKLKPYNLEGDKIYLSDKEVGIIERFINSKIISFKRHALNDFEKYMINEFKEYKLNKLQDNTDLL